MATSVIKRTEIIKENHTVTLGTMSSGASSWGQLNVAKVGYVPLIASISTNSIANTHGQLICNVTISGNTAYYVYHTFDAIAEADSEIVISVLYKTA